MKYDKYNFPSLYFLIPSIRPTIHQSSQERNGITANAEKKKRIKNNKNERMDEKYIRGDQECTNIHSEKRSNVILCVWLSFSRKDFHPRLNISVSDRNHLPSASLHDSSLSGQKRMMLRMLLLRRNPGNQGRNPDGRSDRRILQGCSDDTSRMTHDGPFLRRGTMLLRRMMKRKRKRRQKLQPRLHRSDPSLS